MLVIFFSSFIFRSLVVDNKIIKIATLNEADLLKTNLCRFDSKNLHSHIYTFYPHNF